jgi:RimK family alpha-L-glutamate ligase
MARGVVDGQPRGATVALLGSPTRTNMQLALAWRQLGVDARVLWPAEAIETLGPGDVAITRLDIRPTLDGIEPGIEIVEALEGRGVRLVNRAPAFLACHDKLVTAELLREAGLPHPWTLHIEPDERLPAVRVPCVLKPRFGSWGQDVLLARTIEDVVRLVGLISDRPWWKRHGALVQELVPDVRHDVRVVVAGDQIVAGGQRSAGPGEWRTNVTLGGQVVEAELPPGVSELAIETAHAIGIDFCGVDLLPSGGGWTVLELNGAVDFDTRYALPGIDPYFSDPRGARHPRAELSSHRDCATDPMGASVEPAGRRLSFNRVNWASRAHAESCRSPSGAPSTRASLGSGTAIAAGVMLAVVGSCCVDAE